MRTVCLRSAAARAPRWFVPLALVGAASQFSPLLADTRQSAPSSTTPSSPTPAPTPTPTPSLAGGWQGQAQFHGRENGEIPADAHTVVALNLEFGADGKVSGASPENGCQWVSLNRRYSGSFMLAKPESSGQLSLQSSELPHGTQGARQYDVKSTLRR